jgi:prevent-host-death family protein
MVDIGVRELRGGLAGFVRRAAAGESIVITQSGRPVAVLGPVGGAQAPGLSDLIAHGAVVAPRVRGGAGIVERERLPVDARSDVELRKVR